MRERTMRKAKERAVEHLHEITSNYNKTSLNDENQTTKRNYTKKQQHHSEDEHNSDYETPVNTPQKTNSALKSKQKSKIKQPPSSAIITRPQQIRHHNNTTSAIGGKSGGGVTNEIESDDNSLFHQILYSQSSIQTLIDNWMDTYKENHEQAVIELIQFLIRSSGCKIQSNRSLITKELLKSKDYTDTITELVDYFDEDNLNYPLINNQLQYKRFKTNFSDFIQILIDKCHLSIIYDEYFLDNLITFLINLSDSQIRAFRHTATLAILKIKTQLVNCLLKLNQTREQFRKQLESEKQKSQLKRASERLLQLESRSKELDENKIEIENYINIIFKAVFIHRYRDICTEIRCVCLTELGEWMKVYEEKYLDDTYLKYIGWTLYDKQPECRLKCIQILKPLYENHNFIQKLELFTLRFKQRLLEMILDKDLDICVQTIRLLTVILKTNEQSLEDKDCESLYELVFHLNRSLGQAAGEFLNVKLVEKLKQDFNLTKLKQQQQQSEQNKIYIQFLIQFLIESELHEHPTYLIDSIWNLNPALKDWSTITDLLLTQNTTTDDVNEQYLIEILVCCIKHASTNELPIARAIAQGGGVAKDQKQCDENRKHLTQHFIKELPRLLEKFNADEEKLIYLLQIPLYFDLNQYTLARGQEKFFDMLLEQIKTILSKHVNSKVLECCSLCLQFLCNEDYSIYNKANLMRSLILDELILSLKQIMQAYNESEVDIDELYPLILALKKLSIFAINHNFLDILSAQSIDDYKRNLDDLWSIISILLRATIANGQIDLNVVQNCFNLARAIICWNLEKLKEVYEENEDEEETGGENEDEFSLKFKKNEYLFEIVKKYEKKYYRLLIKLFQNEYQNEAIEMETYFELTDFLILFNENLYKKYSDFKFLHFECPAADVYLLLNYCMGSTFVNERLNLAKEKLDNSDKIEKLHEKRCILAAFCKLIIYNTIPIRFLIDISRGYLKYSLSYGDIIKTTIQSCRDISKVNTIKSLSLALQREFNECVQTLNNSLIEAILPLNTILNTFNHDFGQVKELAKKFFMLFNLQSSSNSSENSILVEFQLDSITYLNQKTINHYENDQPSLNYYFIKYFDILSEFVHKMKLKEKKQLLAHLNKLDLSKFCTKQTDSQWQSYFNYRDALILNSNNSVEEPAQVEVEQQDEIIEPLDILTVNSTNGRKRKLIENKVHLDDEEDEEEVEHHEEEVDEEEQEADLSGFRYLKESEKVEQTIGGNSTIEIVKKTMDSMTIDDKKKLINTKKRSRSPLDDTIVENKDENSNLSEENTNGGDLTLVNDILDKKPLAKRTRASEPIVNVRNSS